MIVGVPKEIKEDETRVGLLPVGVRGALVEAGHDVYFEQESGIGAGVSDEAYMEEGAIVVDTAEEVLAQAEVILRVKEPIGAEFELIRGVQQLQSRETGGFSGPSDRSCFGNGSQVAHAGNQRDVALDEEGLGDCRCGR